MKLHIVDVDSETHLQCLYNLLAQRQPWESISHKKMPSYEDHCKFVKLRPYLVWFLIENEKHDLVGSVYLTRQNELGIFIFKGSRGCGYATWALKEVMRRFPGPFLANVNPENVASRKLFESLGGKLIQVTYGLE